MTLAEKIRELRKERSWTQNHLAEAAVISLRTVQRIEDGEPCSKETLLSIAAALDVDVVELTGTITKNQIGEEFVAKDGYMADRAGATNQATRDVGQELAALLVDRFDLIIGGTFAFIILVVILAYLGIYPR